MRPSGLGLLEFVRFAMGHYWSCSAWFDFVGFDSFEAVRLSSGSAWLQANGILQVGLISGLVGFGEGLRFA